MAFIQIGKVSAIDPGQVMEVTVGQHNYAVCNVDGEIHCLDGECACTGGPLSQGTIRDGQVICPWHGWRFDYRTGVCAYDAAMRVAKFPVQVSGGEIFIDVENPLEVAV